MDYENHMSLCFENNGCAQNFPAFMGIDLQLLTKTFCKNTGLYIHLMNESLFLLVKKYGKQNLPVTMVF